MTPVEAFELISFYAKVNIAVSIVNMIGTGLLIWGTIHLRRGTRMLNEANRSLRLQTPDDISQAAWREFANAEPGEEIVIHDWPVKGTVTRAVLTSRKLN